MTNVQHPVHRIELRVQELGQLFNSMDPTPFHHKDLDPDAEEFIESWALEYPQDSRFQITVHLGQMPPEDPTALVVEAIHNYFDYKSDLARRRVRLLLLEGRTSLMIGAGVLVSCLLGAEVLATFTTGTFLRILQESLTIGGWVAMWRPMQIFLYEWWPLVRRSRIYRSLSRAQVHVLQGKP